VEADQFVAEQTQVGRLLDASPLPDAADALARWIAEHPDLGTSPGMSEAIAFLRSPPLPLPVRPAYGVLYQAAAATLPVQLRETLGLSAVPGAKTIGRSAVQALRWSLGSSPSWHLALVRVGSEVPSGMFRQPLRSARDPQAA
jgi:uncharacterized protein (DUF2236 family)